MILTFYSSLFATRKALIIGNSAYQDAALKNPVNDAGVVANALSQLGFEVTKKTNLDQQGMDDAIDKFTSSINKGDEVLFCYSGHGAQANGENYLIPVGSKIESETNLKYRAKSCSEIVDMLQEKASVSIIVLDACRDNPYKGTRSGSKGLAQISTKFPNQYIIYSTAPGKTATDGNGANSPFTISFVQNINSDKKITDIMQDIANDVYTKTNGAQVPWSEGVLLQDFYFAQNKVVQPMKPSESTRPAQQLTQPNVKVEYNYGSIRIESNTDAEIYLDGSYQQSIKKKQTIAISNITTGDHKIILKVDENQSQTQNVIISKDTITSLTFSFQPPAPKDMVLVEGGSFTMGDTAGGGSSNEKPTHQITLSSFYLGKYEVTQMQWQEVMGNNPSNFKGDNLPVEQVSWYDCVDFCNKLSQKEGLTPCYSRSGVNITCNWNAKGYRLPTEADGNMLQKVAIKAIIINIPVVMIREVWLGMITIL